MIKPSVLGIGVALITSICGSLPFIARLARCSTPNRCCSSVTTSARLLNSTSFCIKACVPTAKSTVPSIKPCFISRFSLVFVEPVRSAIFISVPSKSFVSDSKCCAASISVVKINSDSITQEVKRAKGIEDELRASIKVNAENITSCVTKGNVGSYITQYYNNVIVAFNNSSKYVQINAGEIAIYDYGVSASKKRAVFDEQGNHFYRDNYYVGKIGTNQWVDNNAHKGLVFDLETQGKYMAWAQKPTEGASSYTTILCYSRANSIFTQAGLHLGCNMYGHGWILDNVDLRNCSANGYTTFTGTLPVVLEIHKTDNNGGIGWTYGNVYIKNGLITSIPQ